MKKKYFALIALTLIASAPFLTPLVLANTTATTLPVPGATNGDLWTLLAKALQWLFNIVIFLAAIFLVVAGFQYVTSNGDEKKVHTAMNTLIYALIGVAVAVLAKSLIAMVGHFLGTQLVR